ncbi:mitochondrial assembly of ribosomal large subunit protein 1 [Rhinophrynus dorsalis]
MWGRCVQIWFRTVVGRIGGFPTFLHRTRLPWHCTVRQRPGHWVSCTRGISCQAARPLYLLGCRWSSTSGDVTESPQSLVTSQAQPLASQSDTGEELMDMMPSSFGIDVLVNLLRQENARDICVIRTPPELKYAEYFVVVSGSSTRHIQAMAQYAVKVYKYVKRDRELHVRIEGKDTDDWMCIDFGNIVVHFMLPETRETYELEKLWTLRSYDDQLSQMTPEILPTDFTFGLQSQKE